MQAVLSYVLPAELYNDKPVNERRYAGTRYMTEVIFGILSRYLKRQIHKFAVLNQVFIILVVFNK